MIWWKLQDDNKNISDVIMQHFGKYVQKKVTKLMFNIANFIKIHKFSYLITIFYYNTIPLQDKKKGITNFFILHL